MVVAKIADLKNNLSRYLARVRRGDEIIVYDRQTPVARLLPFDQPATGPGASKSSDRLTALRRQGLVSPGDPKALARWIETHPAVETPAGTPSAVEVLLQMRRESTR
jgi:prevent-host-death family protein